MLLSLFNSTEPRYPPVFDKKLIPVDVTVGDTVELECHMTGSLPIKVTWSKDHKDIRTGGNYKISCVDNTPHLTILKADKADSGRYSCHASNDIGKDSCSTEVSVKGIWSPTVPSLSWTDLWCFISFMFLSSILHAFAFMFFFACSRSTGCTVEHMSLFFCS